MIPEELLLEVRALSNEIKVPRIQKTTKITEITHIYTHIFFNRVSLYRHNSVVNRRDAGNTEKKGRCPIDRNISTQLVPGHKDTWRVET